MAKLIYHMQTSLDGYTADENGNFDWAAPDTEVHAFVNDLQRTIGTYLFGRRMIETMSVWDDPSFAAGSPPEDFARSWHTIDKIVYSTTLKTPSTARTRIESSLDPDEIRRLKAEADRDLAIGGPTLAAHAILAGLVDEYRQVVIPIIVGGGTRFLPDKARINLELIDEHRFTNGTVYLAYRPRPTT